jgi:tellurite methyltransferase
MSTTKLQEQFDRIDIYLFDQLLKGNIAPGMRILDAGCGYGRNLVYLLREGYEVFAADEDAKAIESVRSIARALAPALPETNFRVEPVEQMSFDDECADVVISNTVLHLAADDAQFERMLQGSWRVLKPGGLFFCRIASTIGMEGQFQPVSGHRYRSPDGAERYLVDASMLASIGERLGAEMVEPLKTTVVQDQRSMTTWVVRKKSRP